MKEKKELDKALGELSIAEAKYYNAIDELASTIRGWEWNDPVSSIYKTLFTKDVLIDHDKSREEIATELERRFELKIPPGYKDSAKGDGGVGDLAIWLSVLSLGAKESRDVIFVTEDIKPDWWNQSNGSEFLPRFELIDEFRRASSGSTLHIIRFSELLKLFKVEQELIEAAKKAEEEKKRKLLRFLQKSREETRKRRNAFRRMSKEDQIAEIKGWFFSNYENPVESCPYDSGEGGYQYIWGGPYDAREEIESEFGDIAPDSLIEEIVSELEEECWEWSGQQDE